MGLSHLLHSIMVVGVEISILEHRDSTGIETSLDIHVAKKSSGNEMMYSVLEVGN